MTWIVTLKSDSLNQKLGTEELFLKKAWNNGKLDIAYDKIKAKKYKSKRFVKEAIDRININNLDVMATAIEAK